MVSRNIVIIQTCWLIELGSIHYYGCVWVLFNKEEEEEDKDLFIGPQEFVVGYSNAPEQPQSSARPMCHSHAMTRTGREPATIRIAA